MLPLRFKHWAFVSLATCLFFACCWPTDGFNAAEKTRAEKTTPLVDSPVRTWTDLSGKYEVKAAFVDYDDGRVRLRKADGSETSVKFDQLSLSDQRYVRHQLRRKTLAALAASRRRKASQLEDDPKSQARNDKKTGLTTRGKHGRVVAKLYGVNWRRTPDAAAQAAGGSSGKPIMWFRVLGDLTGFM